MLTRSKLVRLCAWLAVLAFVWASLPVLGGMAELGRKRKGNNEAVQAGEDQADGNGVVSLRADGMATFSHVTSAGEPMSQILVSLVQQVNDPEIQLIASLEGGICSGGSRDGKPCTVGNPISLCVTSGGSCATRSPIGTCDGGANDGLPCQLPDPMGACLVGGGICLAPGVCDGGFLDGSSCELAEPTDLCLTVGLCVGGAEDMNSCVVGDGGDICITGGGSCVAGECLGFFDGLDVRRTRGEDREVSELILESSDSAVGFVMVTRRAGFVSVQAVTDPPAGDGTVEIVINAIAARAATVSTAGFAGDAAGLNDALVAELEFQGFVAELSGGSITISQDLVADQGVFSVAWEDTDTGIVNIRSGASVAAIPTLSELGLALLVLMLGAGALLVLRRKGRPVQT